MKLKPLAVMDIECYRNYFLVAFKTLDGRSLVALEQFPGQLLDVDRVLRILKRYRVVTFNGIGYDMPILGYALTHKTCDELKEMSDRIIVGRLKPWELAREFDSALPRVDHIDLKEVAPGMVSLKLYGGRLHAAKLQDLPIEPSALITPEQRVLLARYCENDLDTTIALFNELRPQIELREAMGKVYGMDLRSKSDAQIAETVIRAKVGELTGEKVSKTNVKPGTVFRYEVPGMVAFKTEALREVLRMVRGAKFVISDGGKVLMPKELAAAKITVGKGVYRMGIGGLHSSESRAIHRASDSVLLLDRDVASYYPSLILLMGLYPKHIGPEFLAVYEGIVKQRLAAKHKGDKVTADVLKIVINGSFGKFGSKYSALFSPNLLIQTTVTGQLCLLMLIEALELRGIEVVSANTDGIVIKCPKHLEDAMAEEVWSWEAFTGLVTEDTHYQALFSRDVNSYIALKAGGGFKTKGAFALGGLAKNPANSICTEAVVRYLEKGVPIDVTVRECKDVRKFLTVRQVTGGAVWRGEYLGKAVRFYYAQGVEGAIHYQKNGNKVPRSDGARPLMDLPPCMPTDVDFNWYLAEAQSLLNDIGYRKELNA